MEWKLINIAPLESPFTMGIPVKEATPKAGDGAGSIAANGDGDNHRVFERPPSGEKSSGEAGLELRRGEVATAETITSRE